MSTPRLEVLLDATSWSKLRKLASATGMTHSAFVRLLISRTHYEVVRGVRLPPLEVVRSRRATPSREPLDGDTLEEFIAALGLFRD